MKLDLITGSKDVLLVEESLQDGILNEGVLDVIDTATEAVFGAIGFVPGIGEVIGDAPMVVKNLMQGDYLGASLYLVSMEPTPVSDMIAKTLRSIQKLARHAGQEKRLNQLIGWLVKKTAGDYVAQTLGLFEKAKGALNKADDQIRKIDGDVKIKKSAGILNKVTDYINQNLDQMQSALTEFLDVVDKRASKLEPVGGVDDEIPDQFVVDLTGEIKETYHRLRNEDLKNGTSNALVYKKKLRMNANKRADVKAAYESIFGQIPEIE